MRLRRAMTFAAIWATSSFAFAVHAEKEQELDATGVELEMELAPEEEAARADEEEQEALDSSAPQILIEQPAPEIIVEQPAPAITIEQNEPEVTIQQPAPEVTIEQAEPKVQVNQEKARIRVEQEEPDVKYQQRLKPEKVEEEMAPAEDYMPMELEEEPARAEDMPEEGDNQTMFTPVPGPIEQIDQAISDAPITDFGASVLVGGGVTNFTQSNLTDSTSVGGYWDVRGSLGTRSILGLEAAYHGNSRDIQAIGLRDETFLVGNGLEGAIRVNAPLTFEQNNLDVLVEPFAFGGVGWTRYNLFNEGTNTSSVLDQDDVFVVPLGLGIAGSVEGVMLDARFTYRPAFGSDLVGSATGAFETDSLSDWSLGANLGFEF